VAPAWAALLALAPEELSPDLFAILAEDTDFSWHEVLGVSETADAATVRRAWTGLALLYHPDKGGRPEQMVRVNAAYERAQGIGVRPERASPLNGERSDPPRKANRHTP